MRGGKRGRKESFQAFFRQSTKFHRSEFVKTITKVHRLDEGNAYIPKMRDFTKDLKEEILRNQRFRAREASYQCYCTSRGRDSSYLVYFQPWGCFKVGLLC